jgi:hypothetical protein
MKVPVLARAAAVRAARTWGTTCFVGERSQVTFDASPAARPEEVALRRLEDEGIAAEKRALEEVTRAA